MHQYQPFGSDAGIPRFFLTRAAAGIGGPGHLHEVGLSWAEVWSHCYRPIEPNNLRATICCGSVSLFNAHQVVADLPIELALWTSTPSAIRVSTSNVFKAHQWLV